MSKSEVSVRNTFPITVNYTQSLDQMIAAGKYGDMSEYITSEHFPITGTGTVETELILLHFDRYIGSDDAVKELAAMGLEPARLEHATVFGAKYPDVQREYPIVFLGSVWADADGHRRVPCLSYWSAERGLDLDWWSDGWGRRYRFAAVSASGRLRRPTAGRRK